VVTTKTVTKAATALTVAKQTTMMNYNHTTQNVATGRPIETMSGDGDEVPRQSTQSGVQRPAVENKRNLWRPGTLVGSKPVQPTIEPNLSEAWSLDGVKRNLQESGEPDSSPHFIPEELTEDPSPPDATGEPITSSNQGENHPRSSDGEGPISTRMESDTPHQRACSAELPEPNNHNDNPTCATVPHVPTTHASQSETPPPVDTPPPEESPNMTLRKKRDETCPKNSKKRSIKIASLNTRGRNYSDHRSKYHDITTQMRRLHIAVLALQETRLDETTTTMLNERYSRFTLLNSGSNTNKDGIGFLLNNELLTKSHWSMTELYHGKACILHLSWDEENYFDIVNVHFPNAPHEKTNFCESLTDKLQRRVKRERTILLGDFNFVENALDRLPQHKDDNTLLSKFDDLTKQLRLVDGWRVDHTDQLDYTLLQTHATGDSLSRIDRIYVNSELFTLTHNWTINDNAGISDHRMPSVEIIKKHQPFIGPGYWKMPPDIIEHHAFIKEITPILKTTSRKINDSKTNRSESNNPQILWQKCKENILKVAKKACKTRQTEMTTNRNTLKRKMRDQLKKLPKAATADVPKIKQKIKDLQHELQFDDAKKVQQMQNKAKANYYAKGERNTKYWFNLNKPKTTIDPIMALYDTQGILRTNTDKMVEIGSQYHADLQSAQEWTAMRELATSTILNKISTKLDPSQVELFEGKTTKDQITKSLKSSQNNKSPGPDGIPYEFYKFWMKQTSENDDTTDIIAMLETVYNDIEEHGVQIQNWTKGIMCLLYKKKDRHRIENYRPITLVNTDYKILTKSIAIKLGEVAPSLIHKNQNGFIPGRGLYDATRTSQMAVDFCETFEINGCIISLDQEKAYDKIAHDYLWKTLEKYGFPQVFINLIKSIYMASATSVMVNGVIPTPINIARGVRQGDPMSCLLYNLAIEPLAECIRTSNLKGLSVPGLEDRIIVSLFADDTLVYFTEHDDLHALKRIINTFCCASTAKFNLEKTEYLPIGTKNFRQKVIKTRCIGDNPHNSIENNVTIIPDGASMRTLGARIGNDIDTRPQWYTILEKQKLVMDSWSKTHPSYKGKELLLKALIQSKALFLATVNGMPKDILTKMNSQMRNFLWDNKPKGYMEWKATTAPKNKGGLNIPNIETRLLAIQTMWIKKFLSPKKNRPDWAYMADAFITKYVSRTPIIDNSARINWLLQSWHESDATDAKIPKTVRIMLKLARKSNIGFDALRLNAETKAKMILWNHPAITNNYLWNKKASRCLREYHEVITVGDALDFTAIRFKQPPCHTMPACIKMCEQILDLLPNKFNPDAVTPHRDNLDHTPSRIEREKHRDRAKHTCTFDPNVTAYGTPMNHVRIFQRHKTYKSRKQDDVFIRRQPANRRQHTQPLDQRGKKHLTIYTDGSSTLNGAENSQAGAGIYVKGHKDMCQSIRIPGEQTNQRAELVAILIAIQKAPDAQIKVYTDSRYCIDGITKLAKNKEDIDWVDTPHEDVWKAILYHLRIRKNTTSFKWVKGHAGIKGNEKADALAAAGALLEQPTEIDTTIPLEFALEGARLQAMTQSLAYKLLQKKMNVTPTTIVGDVSVAEAKMAAELQSTLRPTSAQIWTSMWKMKIEPKIKDFLWKMIHNRLRCGPYFARIPTLRDRKFCICGHIESIEHIIFGCQLTCQNQIWSYIEHLWNDMFNIEWIDPTIDLVKAIGCVRLCDKKGNHRTHTTEAYQTFLTMTTWHIWKARNKTVFEETVPKYKEVKGSLKMALTNHIRTEYEAILTKPYNKQKGTLTRFKKKWCGEHNKVTINKKGSIDIML